MCFLHLLWGGSLYSKQRSAMVFHHKHWIQVFKKEIVYCIKLAVKPSFLALWSLSKSVKSKVCEIRTDSADYLSSEWYSLHRCNDSERCVSVKCRSALPLVMIN